MIVVLASSTLLSKLLSYISESMTTLLDTVTHSSSNGYNDTVSVISHPIPAGKLPRSQTRTELFAPVVPVGSGEADTTYILLGTIS